MVADVKLTGGVLHDDMVVVGMTRGWLVTGGLRVAAFLLRVRVAMGEGRWELGFSSSPSESIMARKGIMEILGAGLRRTSSFPMGPTKSAFAGLICS